MRKGDVLEHVIQVLQEAGYRQALAADTCFDVFGTGQDGSLLLKAHGNIDSASRDDAEEMKQAAQYLGAAPVLVGERNSRGELDQHVIYERYGVPVIKPETLDRYLQVRQGTSLMNTRGGTYVAIDEDKFEQRRKDEGYSLNALAKEVGVSSTTIRKYRKNGAATPEKAERLENALGDVRKEISIFETRIEVRTRPANPLSERLARIGMDAAGFEKAPFDAAARDDNDRFVAAEHGRDLNEQLMRFMQEVQDLAGSRSFVITERRIEIEGLATITDKTLRNVQSKDELKDELAD